MNKTLRRSPDRYQNLNSNNSIELMKYYQSHQEEKLIMEQKPEWQQNNLEYDLRTSDTIAQKCADDHYAQNLYAVLCNNQFRKEDMVVGQYWSCSWRYAGGIVADIRGEGDYIDWYCSGIRDVDYDEKVNKQWDARRYVSESKVTDEIRADLLSLQWVVIDEDEENTVDQS